MVGAGIAGLCLARELAFWGCSVTILADPEAAGATLAATGLLQVAGGRISALHLGLRRACLEHFGPFLQGLEGSPHLRGPGHLRLGGDQASRSAFVSTLAGLGINARNVSADHLGQTEPALRADGAVWLDDDSIDPGALLDALNSSLLRLGVVRQEGRAVGLEGSAVLDSQKRIWKAQAVVLACGTGLAKLCHPDWNFRQSDGWGATFQGELRLECSVEGLGQTLVPLGPQRWKIGGSAPWTGDPPLRAWVSWQGEEVSRQQGVRCSAPDGLPLAGLLRPGVYVLGGLGRNGLLTAPLLAKGLAQEIVEGAPPAWLAPFSPLRPDIGRQRSWSR